MICIDKRYNKGIGINIENALLLNKFIAHFKILDIKYKI